MNRQGYQASRVRRILVGAVLTAVLTHFIPESAGLSLTAGILYTAVELFWTLTLAHRVGPDHTKRLMVTMLQAYAEKMGYEIVPGADLSAYVDEDTMFLSGKLMGHYGIVWNDELDIEAETVYNEGELLRTVEIPARYLVGQAISDARTTAGMTQSELSKLCGIDQSDLSKLERGQLNPSIATLERITKALGCKLSILIQQLG